MPIYVRAGTVLPLDPVRQYVDEPVSEPMTLRIYPGDDGEFELYSDDGRTLDFKDGEYSRTLLNWNDEAQTLTIRSKEGKSIQQQFLIEIVGKQQKKSIEYDGKRMEISFR